MPDSTSVRPGVHGYASAQVLDLRVFSRVPELAVLDPATGEPIGHIPAGGVPEANRVVAAARSAQGRRGRATGRTRAARS